ELLEEEAGRPEGLERLLELRSEPLELPADPGRKLGQPGFERLPRLVTAGVEAEAGEVARERADVRGDRHPVVVQDDHDRGLEADGGLAGPEVRPEVAADLPGRVDYVLADLLREPLELVVVQILEVHRPLDRVEQAWRRLAALSFPAHQESL